MAKIISFRVDDRILSIKKVTKDQGIRNGKLNYFPGCDCYTWFNKKQPEFFNSVYNCTPPTSFSYVGHYSELPEDYVPCPDDLFLTKDNVTPRICSYGAPIGSEYFWENDRPVLLVSHAVHKDDILDYPIEISDEPAGGAYIIDLPKNTIPDNMLNTLTADGEPLYILSKGYSPCLDLSHKHYPNSVYHALGYHRINGTTLKISYEYANVSTVKIPRAFSEHYTKAADLDRKVLEILANTSGITHNLRITELGTTGYYFISDFYSNLQFESSPGMLSNGIDPDVVGIKLITHGNLCINQFGQLSRFNYMVKIVHEKMFIYDQYLFCNPSDYAKLRVVTKKELNKYEIPPEDLYKCINSTKHWSDSPVMVLHPLQSFNYKKKPRKKADVSHFKYTPLQPHRYTTNELSRYSELMSKVEKGELTYVDNKNSTALLQDFGALGWVGVFYNLSLPKSGSFSTHVSYVASCFKEVYPEGLCCNVFFLPKNMAKLSHVLYNLNCFPEKITLKYGTQLPGPRKILIELAKSVQDIDSTKLKTSIMMASL